MAQQFYDAIELWRTQGVGSIEDSLVIDAPTRRIMSHVADWRGKLTLRADATVVTP
jgi:hypothetical protein